MNNKFEAILLGRIEREMNEGRLDDARVTLVELYDMQEDAVLVDPFILDLFNTLEGGAVHA